LKDRSRRPWFDPSTVLRTGRLTTRGSQRPLTLR
jgi:hypothetical protein